MCGLFGWHLKPGVNKRRRLTLQTVATVLMLKNDFRGGDSWGWYSPDAEDIRVGIGDMEDMSRESMKDMICHNTIMAHTRKATTGAVDVKNSHPFDVGSIVGAHNGIVYNHEDLNAYYDRECSVDSEHIFYHIDEEKDLKEIEAYGAITFHDRKREEMIIQLGRFNNGDLAVGRVKGVGVFWSSSAYHLKVALKMAGWGATVAETEDDILYGITTDGKITELQPIDITKPSYSNSMVKWNSSCTSGSGWCWNGATGKFDKVDTDHQVANDEKDYEDYVYSLEEKYKEEGIDLFQ